MATVTVKTGRLATRQLSRARLVVGYRWAGETEMEMLECGHDVLAGHEAGVYRRCVPCGRRVVCGVTKPRLIVR